MSDESTVMSQVKSGYQSIMYLICQYMI